jgi:hypothetical protein
MLTCRKDFIIEHDPESAILGNNTAVVACIGQTHLLEAYEPALLCSYPARHVAFDAVLVSSILERYRVRRGSDAYPCPHSKDHTIQPRI